MEPTEEPSDNLEAFWPEKTSDGDHTDYPTLEEFLTPPDDTDY